MTDAPANYEERFCAFVDVLNFRGLIQQLDSDRISIDAIRNMLSAVHQPPFTDTNSSGLVPREIQAQSISDGVCVSGRCTSSALLQVLFSLVGLAKSLLREGYFVRGALVKGKLYQDSKMVFGRGLVRAYELESTIARYPRILLSRDVVAEIENLAGGDFRTDFTDFIRQANDGPYYLHVLRDIGVVISKLHQTEPIERWPAQTQQFNAIAGKIQSRLEEATDDPRHFEKVQWFARYWNQTVSSYSGLITLVDGPGLSTTSPLIVTGAR